MKKILKKIANKFGYEIVNQKFFNPSAQILANESKYLWLNDKKFNLLYGEAIKATGNNDFFPHKVRSYMLIQLLNLVINKFSHYLVQNFVECGVAEGTTVHEFCQVLKENKKPNQKGFVLPKEKTQYNILLLGYGGPGHDGPYLTDSMMVAHIDLKTNKTALLSLPRDLWIKLPTKSKADFHAKINSIYQLGLFPTEFPDVDTQKYPDTTLVKKAVSDITGLTIDNYVTIDFTGFTKGIDILGGVVVDVQKTFDDYEYPIDGKEKDLCGKDEDFAKIEKFLKPGFSEDEKKDTLKDKPELEKFLKDITEDPKEAFPCRYEHLHFDKGKVFMNGETALKYVRSRHSAQDGNDFARGARQQQFVKSIKE